MKQEEYIQGKWYWFEFKYEYPCIARVNGTTISCSEFALQASDVYTENGVGGFKEHTFFEKDCKGLATTSQIETCLKAYAEKNGYINGVTITFPFMGKITNRTLYGDQYEYDKIGLRYNGQIIYSDQYKKWVDILKHARSVQDKQDQELTERIKLHIHDNDIIISPNGEQKENNIKDVKVNVDGNRVSIEELIDGYKKFLDIKTIIG